MSDVVALPKVERNFDAFCDALDEVVERYKDAEAITFAEAIGALEFIKAKILRQAFNEANHE